jgi:ATP-dependent DNA helicase DinG
MTEQVTETAAVTAPRTFAEAQDVLAASLPGYTRRAHQMALAGEIEAVIGEQDRRLDQRALGEPFEGHRHMLAQAGTGTGKSLAVLIAHLLAGHRTVVATATKALQSQYATKDLPFLEEHLGLPFTWAVIKGRSNYPCLLQMEQVTSPTAAQARVIERVKELSTPEAVREMLVTDREDFPSLPDEEWRPFSISSDECPGKKNCPFGETCLAERAKARAQDADVVITNTAYLIQDLVLRARSDDNVQLLGEISRVVVDEGHTLPEVVRGALEDMIGQGSMVKLARDMGAYMQREELAHELALDIELAAGSLWDHLTVTYRAWVRDKNLGRADPMALPKETVNGEFGPYLAALYVAIEEARAEVNSKRPFEERQKTAKTRLLRRSATVLERIMNYTTSPEGETVRWAELDVSMFRGERRERVKLCSSPVNVGPFLRKLLWEKVPTVLMSATLATGKSFAFMEETLGLGKGEARTFDAGSPFDYPRQAVLFTPDKGRPEPLQKTMVAWRAYAQGATKYLVTASGGGALLLFTSRNAMNEAYEVLADDFRDLGLTVMKQGDSTPGELVRLMKEDGHAVLFALRTFFEGVDIQGSALRLVVLDKLPFTPPTDLVHKAREEALVRRYHSERAGFDHLAIPEMTLVLTQAFGRLIRHVDDRGVVAILDPRLNSKGYGRRIMEALPPAARTTDPRVAAEFLSRSR